MPLGPRWGGRAGAVRRERRTAGKPGLQRVQAALMLERVQAALMVKRVQAALMVKRVQAALMTVTQRFATGAG